jgi:hypothetical protein
MLIYNLGRFFASMKIIMISQNGLLGMISGVISTALLQPFENIKMAIMIPP